jgi:hypothetical protein
LLTLKSSIVHANCTAQGENSPSSGRSWYTLEAAGNELQAALSWLSYSQEDEAPAILIQWARISKQAARLIRTTFDPSAHRLFFSTWF